MNERIGFVGGGRIARIFLEAWTRARDLPAQVVVADPSEETLARLKARFPNVETTTDNTRAAAQGIVFLGVHPPVLATVATQIAGAVRPEALFVSLAPKWTIEKLAGFLGGFRRIARANPSAPSVVGAGFNPIAYGAALKGEDRARIAAVFAALGESPEVPELKLEAYALFTAMGPTYFWYQMQVLRELAVSFGLTESEARTGLRRMMNGAVETLLSSDLSPAEVMDLVPVKPLAEMEPMVTEFYRTRLPALHQKIRP